MPPFSWLTWKVRFTSSCLSADEIVALWVVFFFFFFFGGGGGVGGGGVFLWGPWWVVCFVWCGVVALTIPRFSFGGSEPLFASFPRSRPKITGALPFQGGCLHRTDPLEFPHWVFEHFSSPILRTAAFPFLWTLSAFAADISLGASSLLALLE